MIARGSRALAFAAALALVATLAPATVAHAAPPPPIRIRIGLCTIEAPAGNERAADALAVEADGIQSEVESELGLRPASSYRVALIPPASRLDPELARIDGSVPTWAAGYAIGPARLIVIRTAEASRFPYGTVASVYAHELAHLLMYDALGERLPLWCNEGIATWQGRKWGVADAFVVSGALLTQGLPPLDSLDRAFHGSSEDARLAYAASFAFTASSVRRYGPAFPARLVAGVRTRSFSDAWRAAAGEPFAVAEARWRRSALLRYRWLPIVLSASTLWTAITLLAIAAIGRRRREAARVRETLPDEPWFEEAAPDAAAPARDDGVPPTVASPSDLGGRPEQK